jgi:hypothetical protein
VVEAAAGAVVVPGMAYPLEVVVPGMAYALE